MLTAAGFDLAQTDRLLTTTRSVRKRLDLTRPVEREVVLQCLRIALQAPSGGNSQPWRWLIVDDPTVRARLAELYRRSHDPSPAATRLPHRGRSKGPAAPRRAVPPQPRPVPGGEPGGGTAGGSQRPGQDPRLGAGPVRPPARGGGGGEPRGGGA